MELLQRIGFIYIYWLELLPDCTVRRAEQDKENYIHYDSLNKTFRKKQ